MKERLFKELKILFIILAVGFTYLILASYTAIKIPCFFHVITGFNCPGCGISRMCIAVFQGDFASAIKYNPVMFFTLPILLGCLIFEKICYIKTGYSKMHMFTKVFTWFELVILIIYGIVRNL